MPLLSRPGMVDALFIAGSPRVPSECYRTASRGRKENLRVRSRDPELRNFAEIDLSCELLPRLFALPTLAE